MKALVKWKSRDSRIKRGEVFRHAAAPIPFSLPEAPNGFTPL